MTCVPSTGTGQRYEKKSNKQILFNKIDYLMWIYHFVLIGAIWGGADVCKNRAELLKKFKNRNSEIPPLKVANRERSPPGGVSRGYWSRVGLTQKNFFCQKMPVLEEKVG